MSEINEFDDLVKTGEYRQPELGEYFYCEICESIEVCTHPTVCPSGWIYRKPTEKERIEYSLRQLESLREKAGIYGVSKIGLDSIEERIAYWRQKLCEAHVEETVS